MRILLTSVGFKDPFNPPVVTGSAIDGPVLTALAQARFDFVYAFADEKVLANARALMKEIRRRYSGVKNRVLEIVLRDPTDYEAIFDQLLRETQAIQSEHENDKPEYFVLPVSGTPQIHTVWFLLTQSNLLPATLLKITEAKYLRPGESALSEIRLALQDFPKVTPGERAALELTSLRNRNEKLEAEREVLFSEVEAEGIIGMSKALQETLRTAKRAAQADAPILLLGEPGTGKGVLAKAIHHWSKRAAEPFQAVNCAAIPSTLLESELFGHEKGAYTGADKPRRGKFELAEGGTIFLDEVGELPLESQPKLLRALREREIQKLGSERTIRVSTRVIAATNRDLRRRVDEGAFREDLYYRLNVIPIQIPPLRARREDIPLLAHHFLDRAGATQKIISRAALKALSFHDWPGNVAELENVMTWVVAFATGNEIIERDLPPEVRSPSPRNAPRQSDIVVPAGGLDLQQHLEVLKRRYVRKALDVTRDNREAAAHLLRVKPATLRQWLRRWRAGL